jgi:hypothetical protein
LLELCDHVARDRLAMQNLVEDAPLEVSELRDLRLESRTTLFEPASIPSSPPRIARPAALRDPRP